MTPIIPDATMVYCWERGVLFVRHSALSPTNQAWNGHIRLMEQHVPRGGAVRTLVKTDGGGPSASQREALNAVTKELDWQMKVAVMTQSVVVRGIITAFAWVGLMKIRAFPMDGHAAALNSLEADPLLQAQAESIFQKLEANLSKAA